MATLSIENASVLLQMAATQKNADTNASAAMNGRLQDNIVNGTGAGQSNRLWYDIDAALTSGSSRTIDFSSFSAEDIGAGAGRGPLGITYSNTKCLAILALNAAASAGSMKVGLKGTETNPWENLFIVGATKVAEHQFSPGGGCIFFDGAGGWTIASGSNCELTITAVSGNITYSLYAMLID